MRRIRDHVQLRLGEPVARLLLEEVEAVLRATQRARDMVLKKIPVSVLAAGRAALRQVSPATVRCSHGRAAVRPLGR